MKLSERFDWLEDVQRIMGRDTVAFAVAFALLRRQNRKTGQCNPSYETIARDCGFDHRDTARDAAKRLRKAGLISYKETFGGNRQNTNHYTLTRCCGAPGAVEHPVLNPPFYPVLASTTEPVGNPAGVARKPPEAAFRAPPREKPSPENQAAKERAFAEMKSKGLLKGENA